MTPLMLRIMTNGMTDRQKRRYVAAAVSWGMEDPENAAVTAIAQTLQKRGFRLKQRGDNGSWYCTREDLTVRIGDHLGRDSHDIDIVIDYPLTRMQTWRYVAETLKNARETT